MVPNYKDIQKQVEPRLEEKYQFKPFLGSSHAWALSKAHLLDKRAKILDFGAGPGFLGAALKASEFSELYAVEPDNSTHAQHATAYIKSASNIEQLNQSNFDLALLLDVLEHVPNHRETFRTIIERLNPGGQILLSLPNVGHWSARLSLLFGRFNEYNRGILDKTHLHFFTRRVFLAFLAEFPELEVIELSASISPAELALPAFVGNSIPWKIFSEFRLTAAKAFPEILAYQHLAVLTKR